MTFSYEYIFSVWNKCYDLKLNYHNHWVLLTHCHLRWPILFSSFGSVRTCCSWNEFFMPWQRELHLLVAFSECVWYLGKTSLRFHPRGISWPRFFTPTLDIKEKSVWTFWRGIGKQNWASDMFYLYDASTPFFYTKCQTVLPLLSLQLISLIPPQTIKCLLIHPNPESALNEEAGRLLLEDYAEYESRARLLTEIHAMGGPGGTSGTPQDPNDGPQPKKHAGDPTKRAGPSAVAVPASLGNGVSTTNSSNSTSSSSTSNVAGKKKADKKRALRRL